MLPSRMASRTGMRRPPKKSTPSCQMRPTQVTNVTSRARAPRRGPAARSRSASLRRSPEGAMTPEKRLGYEDAVARKARQLVVRVVLPGEWYLVRWGGTRKGSGTFYTRPGLAVPTVHRTLRPLAYTPPTQIGRHARPRRAACRVDTEDARGDSRAQGLRSGVWLWHLPGGGAAFPDRRTLRLAPPSRPRVGRRRPSRRAVACGVPPQVRVRPRTVLARNYCRAARTMRSSSRASRPSCAATSSSAASTAWISIRWRSSFAAWRCGSRRWTARCRSRSSTTRSSAATASSARGSTRSSTTR